MLLLLLACTGNFSQPSQLNKDIYPNASYEEREELAEQQALLAAQKYVGENGRVLACRGSTYGYVCDVQIARINPSIISEDITNIACRPRRDNYTKWSCNN